MAAQEMQELRRSALEGLNAAQEAISVKSIVDFRLKHDITAGAKAVVVAAASMVSGVDGESPRRPSWEIAHARMAMPGRFVDTLRKFPLAVDAGEIPVDNVVSAREALEGVTPNDIRVEPLAQNLHQWIFAAWRYCELAPPPRPQARQQQGGAALPAVPKSFGEGVQVTIIGATGLKNLHFAGNSNWCSCTVQGHRPDKGFQTKAIAKTNEPMWDESCKLEWQEGESLDFTIYDQGMLGSKSQGSVTVLSKDFYPNAIEAQFPISGLENALLHLRIIPILGHAQQQQQQQADSAAARQPQQQQQQRQPGARVGANVAPAHHQQQQQHVPAAATRRSGAPANSGGYGGNAAPRPSASAAVGRGGQAPIQARSRIAVPARPAVGQARSAAPISTSGGAGYVRTSGLKPTATTSQGRTVAHPGVEDWRAKLEQVRRETREMKAMDAQLKWNMKRDEEKQRKLEKSEDFKDTMLWRQEQKKAAQEYTTVKKHEEKVVDLRESRDFQEAKRVMKQADKEVEVQEIREAYMETKENSDWHVEMQKAIVPEMRREVIEANLERYKVFAEHHLNEEQREKNDVMEALQLREQNEMDYQMAQAKAERERALAGLEHVRQQQPFQVPGMHHLAARPQGAAERG